MRQFFIAILVTINLAAVCQAARAAVIVLVNQTEGPVDLAVASEAEPVRRFRLAPGQTRPVPVVGDLRIAYGVGGEIRRGTLKADSIYWFRRRDEAVELTAWTAALPEGQPPSKPLRLADRDRVLVVPVKILVDDNEITVQRVWEERLRGRLDEVSKIIEAHCRVRFEVVATGTWKSDDRIADFATALREFEQKCDPGPAKVAIGFSSRHQAVKGRHALGGTRQPLHSHILVREWTHRPTETERLLVLLHELGHYLGAAHCADPDSIMRPLMANERPARALDYRVGFDPLNTLAMNLVADELRRQPVASLVLAGSDTKARLRQVYQVIAQGLPGDTCASRYVDLLDRLPNGAVEVIRRPGPVTDGTGVVVAAILAAARENRRELPGASGTAGKDPLTGDRLTEFYVRRAARAAGELPEDVAARAFLIGLGIAVDDSSILRDNPLLGPICRRAETDQQRTQRLALLGNPTMRGRRDLAQHFVVSCAISGLLGPRIAQSAGLVKEMADSRRGSGFSMADLAADMAGIALAENVGQGRIPIDRLADSFAVEDFLPDHQNLPEGLSWDEVRRALAEKKDNPFRRQMADIARQIQALPGYRKQ